MKRILSIGALCAAMFAFVLTSCGPNDPDTFTVKFNSQGGSAVADITNVADGATITKPAPDPTKEGCDFMGWYKETACINAWNFASDVVTKNITLYAKWDETDPNAEVVELDSLSYDGDYMEAGTECFYMIFYNGAGLYHLDLYSPSLVTIGNAIAPAEGTYNYDAAGTGAAFTINDEYSRVYDDATTDEYIKFASGSVKLTRVGDDYKVAGNLVDENGVERIFVYRGPLSIDMVECWGDYWGDYFGNGTQTFRVVIYNHYSNEVFRCDFNSASAVGGAPQAGNYTFVGALLDGAAPGAAGTFAAYYEKEGVNPEISGGTLTISASAITVNLTCSDGAHSVTYEGAISWSDAYSAPAKVAPKTNFVEKGNFSGKKPFGKFSLKK